MNDLTIKMKLPGTVQANLLLLALVFFSYLCGCATKSTVVYVPHDECSETAPQLNSIEVLDMNQEITEALKEYYTSWQGTRYRYGGLSHDGIDCSGFTLLTYKELFGQDLPRTVQEQVKEGTKISKSSLQAGDLIFFKTGRFQRHVGIYLEDDLFIHASRSKGVIISSLNDLYWQARYWKAQRIQSEAVLEKLASGTM